MRKLTSTLVLLALLVAVAPSVYASEVTGTLSSSGVSSPTAPAPTGGSSTGGSTSGGGGGGGGIIGLFGATNGGTGGTVAGASTAAPQQSSGLVRNPAGNTSPTAGVPATGGVVTGGVEGPTQLAVNEGTANNDVTPVALVGATSAGLGAWLWWILALVLLLAIGYYLYTRYGQSPSRVSRY